MSRVPTLSKCSNALEGRLFDWIFKTKPWQPARGLSRSLEEVWGGTGFLSLSNELPLGHKQTETCRSGWVLESGPRWVGCFKERSLHLLYVGSSRDAVK